MRTRSQPPRHKNSSAPTQSTDTDEASGSRSRGTGKTLRRAHRKSRNGCWECKRRHIKCDETRPHCSNCLVTERFCSYPAAAAAPTVTPAPSISSHPESPVPDPNPALAVANNGGRTGTPTESTVSSVATSQYKDWPLHRSSHDFWPGLPMVPNDEIPLSLSLICESSATSPTTFLANFLTQPIYTAKHLILLRHAQVAMHNNNEFMQVVIDLAVSCAMDAPYAVDQVLAFAADHLAMQKLEDTVAYRHTSTELQTRSLMSFNREVRDHGREDPTRNSLPRFLFASLLSIHKLYETLTYYRTSFHIFLNKFIEDTYLHRGVRSVVESTYGLMLKTPLSPYLINVRLASVSDARGTECLELERLIESSDLSADAILSCKGAAQTLQWAFNVHANLPAADRVHAATAFPVLLTAGFVDALKKHRPEGVLVLAYYGVLLHRCRKSWIIGDGGAFLIQLIADYLGSSWQEPMRWPLEVLKNEQG